MPQVRVNLSKQLDIELRKFMPVFEFTSKEKAIIFLLDQALKQYKGQRVIQ